MGLKKSREALSQRLMADGGASFPAWAAANRVELERLVLTWRDALKASEAMETFEDVYADRRMSVRSFSPAFDDEVDKRLKDFKIVGTGRVRPDSQYVGGLPAAKQREIAADFNESPDLKKFYDPRRGMDSTAFADPANFATRLAKYSAGLHDISASLLNPEVPIFDQVHHKTDQGAFFAFVPLPHEEDQALLYHLIRAAKALKGSQPWLYDKVRALRAEITRVKLAGEDDMALGYSIVPVANPVQGQPAHKLRYGLGAKATPVEGETPDAKLTAFSAGLTMMVTTQEVYEARQKSGMNYKSILGRAMRRTEGRKTEILLALRHHGGSFPVFGKRVGNELKELSIAGGVQGSLGRTLPLKYA
jgi:hypothetical protein